jgi:hypothetical protein
MSIEIKLLDAGDADVLGNVASGVFEKLDDLVDDERSISRRAPLFVVCPSVLDVDHEESCGARCCRLGCGNDERKHAKHHGRSREKAGMSDSHIILP